MSRTVRTRIVNLEKLIFEIYLGHEIVNEDFCSYGVENNNIIIFVFAELSS